MRGLQTQDQTWRLPGERQGMVGWEAGVELQLAQGVMGQYHILLKTGSTGEFHHRLERAYTL